MGKQYRTPAIWPIAAILAALGIVALFGVRDVRYEAERRLRAAVAEG